MVEPLPSPLVGPALLVVCWLTPLLPPLTVGRALEGGWPSAVRLSWPLLAPLDWDLNLGRGLGAGLRSRAEVGRSLPLLPLLLDLSSCLVAAVAAGET